MIVQQEQLLEWGAWHREIHVAALTPWQTTTIAPPPQALSHNALECGILWDVGRGGGGGGIRNKQNNKHERLYQGWWVAACDRPHFTIAWFLSPTAASCMSAHQGCQGLARTPLPMDQARFSVERTR